MDGGPWDKVLESLTESFKGHLNQINDRNYVDFCCDNEEIRRVVEQYLNNCELNRKFPRKNNEISIKKRNLGNEKFKENKYEESLSLYTESIFYAESNHESLPLAYSNRSLVLEKMGYISESLESIDLALSMGYPRDKLGKLILRKAKCLIKLGYFKKAQKLLEDTIKESSAKDLVQSISKELSLIKNVENDASVTNSFDLPELVGGENNNFASASAYLNVFYTKNQGRHVVAAQDIKTGDVLFVEKPFAFVTFKEVCHGCCQHVIAPIPCDTCLDVFYCSSKCKENFWKSIHSFECGFGELFKSIGIAHLSLRVVLAASSTYDELKRNLDNIVEDKLKDGIISFNSRDYSNAYNLVTHVENHEPNDLFQYVMTALLLALYLKNHTTYFCKKAGNDELKTLVSVLWRHILQLICNGHAIASILLKDSNKVNLHKGGMKVVESVEKRIGTAIYPSVSMMNHSCEPSIIHSFYRNYLVVRALKPIKNGEEVFNCYGPHARRMARAERQEILSKQYFFKCKCQACSQPYDIQDIFTALKCKVCTGPSVPKIEENPKNRICLVCGEISDIAEEHRQKQNLIYSLLKEGERLIDQDINLALKKFLQSWRLGKEIFYKFHSDLSYAADEVARCLAAMGDFRRCIMFLKCCVLSVEERFGSFSIELANELKKLGDAITSYCVREEANKAKMLAREGLEYYQKSQRIIVLLCGQESQDLKEIEENNEILLSFLTD